MTLSVATGNCIPKRSGKPHFTDYPSGPIACPSLDSLYVFSPPLSYPLLPFSAKK